MKTLLEQVFASTLELTKELKKVEHVFVTSEDLDNWSDAIYEAPRIGYISKYDYYDEYAIIYIKDGFVCGVPLSEGLEHEKVFALKELSTDELCNIANNI